LKLALKEVSMVAPGAQKAGPQKASGIASRKPPDVARSYAE
jgi:hypothetical protein